MALCLLSPGFLRVWLGARLRVLNHIWKGIYTNVPIHIHKTSLDEHLRDSNIDSLWEKNPVDRRQAFHSLESWMLNYVNEFSVQKIKTKVKESHLLYLLSLPDWTSTQMDFDLGPQWLCFLCRDSKSLIWIIQKKNCSSQQCSFSKNIFFLKF